LLGSSIQSGWHGLRCRFPTGFAGSASALIVTGALVVTWGQQALGKNFTDTVVTRKEHTLVTNGPYRWVRNPLYSSYFVIVTGTTLLMSNWYPAVVGAGVLALVVIRTRKEEANLIERFGDDYRDYMQRVGRFFPRICARQ